MSADAVFKSFFFWSTGRVPLNAKRGGLNTTMCSSNPSIDASFLFFGFVLGFFFEKEREQKQYFQMRRGRW